MANMLLVRDDVVLCEAVAQSLRSSGANSLQYALTGAAGATLIKTGQFEVALISAALPDSSGVELATLAANENVSVLILSEDARLSNQLKREHYHVLEKPFTLEALLAESQHIMLERDRNIREVRSSYHAMAANIEVLKQEIAESNRLFDTIVSRLLRKGRFWK